MDETVYHIPALLEQSMEALNPQLGGVYVDVTYGGGGHSHAIMERIGAEGMLYAFDRDEEALARAPEVENLILIHANFKYLENFLDFYGADKVDGVLADLGVSFHHFDDPERGFSFRWEEGPLDMRMNRRSALTAAEVLNSYTEEELADIFYLYGELKNARKIARTIVSSRQKGDLSTVGELLKIIGPLIDPRQEKKELAQVFQALRIVVNGETEALKQLLVSACDSLKPGGRMVIITYHSLEDRLVKNFMKTGNFEGKENKDFYGKSLAPMKPLYSKPIVPDNDEIERNPRSRSAKLRAAVKI